MNTFRNSILKKTAKDSKGKRKHVVIKFDVIKRQFCVKIEAENTVVEMLVNSP